MARPPTVRPKELSGAAGILVEGNRIADIGRSVKANRILLSGFGEFAQTLAAGVRGWVKTDILDGPEGGSIRAG